MSVLGIKINTISGKIVYQRRFLTIGHQHRPHIIHDGSVFFSDRKFIVFLIGQCIFCGINGQRASGLTRVFVFSSKGIQISISCQGVIGILLIYKIDILFHVYVGDIGHIPAEHAGKLQFLRFIPVVDCYLLFFKRRTFSRTPAGGKAADHSRCQY